MGGGTEKLDCELMEFRSTAGRRIPEGRHKSRNSGGKAERGRGRARNATSVRRKGENTHFILERRGVAQKIMEKGFSPFIHLRCMEKEKTVVAKALLTTI